MSKTHPYNNLFITVYTSYSNEYINLRNLLICLSMRYQFHLNPSNYKSPNLIKLTVTLHNCATCGYNKNTITKVPL